MAYKRALAQETYRIACELEDQLQEVLPFQDGWASKNIVAGIALARELRQLAKRRLEENESQQRRRNGSPTALLPAPRSNHDGA